MKSPKCKIVILQLVEYSVSSFSAKALKCHNIKEKENVLLLRCDNVIDRQDVLTWIMCCIIMLHDNVYIYNVGYIIYYIMYIFM